MHVLDFIYLDHLTMVTLDILGSTCLGKYIPCSQHTADAQLCLCKHCINQLGEVQEAAVAAGCLLKAAFCSR